MDAVIARHVDDAAVIQRGVEHGQRLVFGHVHLVQHAEAAQTGAAAHRPFPKLHLSVLQRIGADERRRIHVHIHGHVPHRTAEHRRQILRQHVFAGSLGTGQEQMLPAQQRSRRALPDLPTVIQVAGLGDALRRLLRRRMRLTEPPDLLQQCRIHAFRLQLLKNVHICASPLFDDAVLYTRWA